MEFLLSLLPTSIARRLTLIKDTLICVSAIAIGRVLPQLKVPPANLHGKTAIVTGANSGIGLQIATDLARNGATVVLACRNTSRAKNAVNTIHWRVPGSVGRVKALQLDTSDLENVKAFALAWSGRPTASEKQIDILVHNAGIAGVPGGKRLNDDGIEIMYATNLLGPFLLTYLIEPYLSPEARIVFTSSTAHYGASGTAQFSNDFALGPVRGVQEPGFHCPMSRIPFLGWERVDREDFATYGNTKCMQCALAKLLQRRWDRSTELKSQNQRVNSESPYVDDGTQEQQSATARRIAHAFSPGLTSTPIFGKLELKNWWNDPMSTAIMLMTSLAVDIDQGSATGSWLASTNNPDVIGPGKGGGYWDRMTRRMSKADLFDEELLQRLWTRWENDAGIEWR